MITLPAALDARLQQRSDSTDNTMYSKKDTEKQGLLVRSRVPGSGRRTNATLTDAGYAKVIDAASGHVAAVRSFFVDALAPADVATLQRIGLAVARRINPERPFVHGTDG